VSSKIPVIKKPDKTKNRSTPDHPKSRRPCKSIGRTPSDRGIGWIMPEWHSITINTAMPRTPSNSGISRSVVPRPLWTTECARCSTRGLAPCIESSVAWTGKAGQHRLTGQKRPVYLAVESPMPFNVPPLYPIPAVACDSSRNETSFRAPRSSTQVNTKLSESVPIAYIRLVVWRKNVTVLARSGFSANVRERSPGPVVFKIKNSS